MNANPQKSLRKIPKITIEEFDFLLNPALRDMFVPEVRNDPFLRGINVLEYFRSPRKRGEICGVVLTGPPDALRKFRDKFLKDEKPEAYELEYL